MSILVNVLILFFISLLVYQIFLAYYGSTIEGLENADYKEYDTNDPNNALILAQQNAGNISYLKGRIDEVMGLKTQVDKNTTSIDELNSQMNQLVQSQADAATSLVGTEPPTITGTADEDETTP